MIRRTIKQLAASRGLRKHAVDCLSSLAIRADRWCREIGDDRSIAGCTPLRGQRAPETLRKPDQPPKKNIVWIVLDSLRYDVMRGHAMNGGFASLLDRGTWFDAAYANGSWTYPSIMSFVSGLYPFNIGASSILEEDGQVLSACDDFNPEIETIFDRLGSAGYEVRSLMDGWELTVTSTANQEVDPGYFERRWGQRFPQDRYKVAPSEMHRLAQGQLDQLTSGDAPFCLFIRSLSTHFKTGYNGFFRDLPEIEYLCKAGLHGEVYKRLVDSLAAVERDLIAPLVRDVESRGLMDDTIFIIHSDHGDMLWNLEADLQLNSKVGKWNMAAWTHNIEPYQALIRVPLLISGAGMKGSYSDRFRLVDLVPTLLDTIGISYDAAEFDGISLFEPGDRDIIYADSADYSSLGGIALIDEASKIMSSRRFGTVSYASDDCGYERIEERGSDSDAGALRAFVDRHRRGRKANSPADHQAILEDRLRGLGYL